MGSHMAEIDHRLWANVCANCGQSQNADHAEHGIHAPMIHGGAPGVPFMAMGPEHIKSHHLDCMPHDLEAAHRAQHGEAIDAAKAGVRGEELHAIVQRHAAAFQSTEQAWLADEAAEFERSGVANHNPTHPMHTKEVA